MEVVPANNRSLIILREPQKRLTPSGLSTESNRIPTQCDKWKADLDLGVTVSKGSNVIFKTVLFCSYLLASECAPISGRFPLHNNKTRRHQQVRVYILFPQLEVHQKESSSFPNNPSKRPGISHFSDCLSIVTNLPISELIAVCGDALLWFAVSASHM